MCNDITRALPDVSHLIVHALAEDIGSGDVTTLALIPPDVTVQATIATRQRCCVAGIPVATAVFQHVEPSLTVDAKILDGAIASPGQTLMTLNGRLGGILTAERTALNFLQRLCGIATLTAEFVAATRPYKVDILDTRKTTPTLRSLEKYAVTCGGGKNHRAGLYDMLLIKDNHRRFWQTRGGLSAAVKAARARYPELPIEVEVETEQELREALSAQPDWILLDNMSLALMRRCVEINAGGCRLEASGGITLANAADIAATGVNAISLGCLTHSAPAADLTLELE